MRVEDIMSEGRSRVDRAKDKERDIKRVTDRKKEWLSKRHSVCVYVCE